MAARQTAPVIGALCSTSVEKIRSDDSRDHDIEVTVAYRYQSSFRHFIGTVEQKQREYIHTQIVNNYHLFDIAVSYRLTPRWTLTGRILPIGFDGPSTQRLGLLN